MLGHLQEQTFQQVVLPFCVYFCPFLATLSIFSLSFFFLQGIARVLYRVMQTPETQRGLYPYCTPELVPFDIWKAHTHTHTHWARASLLTWEWRPSCWHWNFFCGTHTHTHTHTHTKHTTHIGVCEYVCKKVFESASSCLVTFPYCEFLSSAWWNFQKQIFSTCESFAVHHDH